MGSSSSSPALTLLRLSTLLLLAGQRQGLGLSPSRRHIWSVVDRLNERHGPFLALVMAYNTESDAVESSGAFVSNSEVPWVDIDGRRFRVGTICGVPVIVVMSGQRRLNAGITTQMLIDHFDLKGIVHYGTAGGADDSLSFGDVIIAKHVVFTGSWNWMRYNSTGDEFPDLTISVFNTPQNGGNLLGRIEFKPEEFFPAGGRLEEVFLMETYTAWYQLAAEKLKDVKLDSCANSTYCLPSIPKVVTGVIAGTADIFLDNAAYRQFLHNKFNVSTVDEESAAIVMTAKSPGVPVIVIRGVSDLAGGEGGWSSTTLSSLAATNALKVAIKFVELIGKKEVIHRRFDVGTARR